MDLMASEQLQIVLQMLENSPIGDGDDFAARRESMEAATGLLPVPDGCHFEPVDAGGVPAEWVHHGAPDKNRVLLYLHGGGYAIGSINTHRALAGGLSKASGGRVLNVDYRLAPEHPFPAALDDAVAAYRWLLAQGVEAQHIAIAGDSAGGGLTLATLVALRDAGDPLPCCAAPLSPWTDLAFTGATHKTNLAVDPMVNEESLTLMAKAYLGNTEARTPLASPLYADCTSLPPLLIQVGSAEVLLDDSVMFADRAKAAGVDVTLEVWDDMIHVFQAFFPILPEGQQAVDRVGEFLSKHWA